MWSVKVLPNTSVDFSCFSRGVVVRSTVSKDGCERGEGKKETEKSCGGRDRTERVGMEGRGGGNNVREGRGAGEGEGGEDAG